MQEAFCRGLGCAEGRSPFAEGLGVTPNLLLPPKSGGQGVEIEDGDGADGNREGWLLVGTARPTTEAFDSSLSLLWGERHATNHKASCI